MDLAQLSNSRGAFYVPAFAVRVAGRDLLRDLLIAVSQVEVDLALSAAGRFSFTVVNAYDIDRHAFVSGAGRPVLDTLTFNAAVDIRIGYGDVTALGTIMTGVITEIGTNFPENGLPELTVAGYDRSFPLTVGKNSRTWAKASDSDAVAEIASLHNLAAQIESTKEKHAQIEQNQETDIDFVKKLAERNHFEFYVRKDTLHFGKPKDKGSGVVRLKWGEGLLSFRPEANLAGQVSAVEVYGWDTKTKQQIKGVARAGDESGREPGAKSAADLLQRPGKTLPVLRLRQPVFTKAEADERARSALNESAKQFLTGEAESLGVPEILPDESVALDNLGVPFSKTYYVQQTVHKVDGNGYRTRFKVKETTL
jgi:phage protein D